MKRKFSFKRAAATVLTGVLGLTCLWPALTARAIDISIDDSAFRDPTKTSMTNTVSVIGKSELPAK